MPAHRKIEDYALIGDCESAALVSRAGSIDWLCWPRFDSGACFTALLGASKHGRWIVAPASKLLRCERRYVERTLVLETDFETADGMVTVTDFMPPRDRSSSVIRLVTGRRGAVKMHTELIIRFDYGTIVPWVTRADDGALRAVGGPHMAVLRTPVALRGQGLTTVGAFTVSAGETVPFVLSYGRSSGPMPPPVEPDEALRETQRFWRDWTEHLPPSGRWSAAVARSLITLKALIYAPTGGIVAAPTTSLPEQRGGSWNWDYRMCWLRDATFALLALMNNGYFDEARAWQQWLLRSIAGDPADIQVVYGLEGERRLVEWEPSWLPGFDGAAPVRIGNVAATQCQLDIYGELMDALYQGHCGRLPIDKSGWAMQRRLLKHLESIWREPDHSIWEVRGERRQFTYSKVMAWAAFDRAIRSAEQFGLTGAVGHWRALRDRIRDEVLRKGYDPSRGAFVQSFGSKQLDASLLLMPLVGFLPAQDRRMRSTIEAIERELKRDGLVMRSEDFAKHSNEGAFLACNFWLADNLMLLGRRDDAVALLERLLSLRNDVGLLAEEYDLRERRQAGNFPQAVSHVALINTVHNLTRTDRPAEQRPRGKAA